MRQWPRLFMLSYRIPSGVTIQRPHPDPLLSTPQGGRVAIDARVLDLWERAHERTLSELVDGAERDGISAEIVRAALACLAEAGLLLRDTPSTAIDGRADDASMQRVTGPLVSVVVVAYNSADWLDDCLGTLARQTYSPLEVILVDNGSREDPSDWVRAHYPDVTLVRRRRSSSLAAAINAGVASAGGQYYLVLNPDLALEPDAVAHLVSVAESDLDAAAVAAKLRFSWAPAFLNGLGNRVESSSWGTDNAIGQLDLGQFDDWCEVPSACYAATLIRASAWNSVGRADEGFPFLYEDTEWCYRARLLGYRVRMAPRAVVYHAFGSRVATGEEQDLTPRKLRRAVQGRLRFASKLLELSTARRFVGSYLREDWANTRAAARARDWATLRAYLRGWSDFAVSAPSVLRGRRSVQSRRRCSDEELFAAQREMPPALISSGVPELTWDTIVNHYLPALASGRTRPVPEFDAFIK